MKDIEPRDFAEVAPREFPATHPEKLGTVFARRGSPMQRALERAEVAGADHVRGELVAPPTQQAMGHMLEALLGQALQVRDAPPVLRTFARTTKHMIPAMVEAMAQVPESEVVDILRYVQDELNQVLGAYDGPPDD